MQRKLNFIRKVMCLLRYFYLEEAFYECKICEINYLKYVKIKLIVYNVKTIYFDKYGKKNHSNSKF